MSISQRRATVERLLSVSPTAVERSLWALAIVSYGLLDVALTSLALQHPRVIETNGLAATAHEFAGVAGLLGHKAGALLALVILWLAVDEFVDVLATRLDVPVSGLTARWIVPALTLAHGARVVLANVSTLLEVYS